MEAAQLDVLKAIEPVLAGILAEYRGVEDSWQPSDLLPDLAAEGWQDRLAALRAEAAGLEDATLVVLVGNVITEEALPSYQTALNRCGGLTDSTGTDAHAWARWSRAWTAEEQRHGSVASTYLYLCARVDLRAVEATTQHLLRNGFDSGAGHDPYRGLAYTAFQERATRICWTRVGRLAAEAGAPCLARICGAIAGDEARHERVYQTVLREVLRRAPADALAAMEDVWGHGVRMPARTMGDGHDPRLFERFADLNQRMGVYTIADYAEILGHVVEFMGIAEVSGLHGEDARRQDVLCGLPARYRTLAAGAPSRARRPQTFRWVHGRTA